MIGVRPVLLVAAVINVGEHVEPGEGRVCQAGDAPADHDVGHRLRIGQKRRLGIDTAAAADGEDAVAGQGPDETVSAAPGGEELPGTGAFKVDRDAVQRIASVGIRLISIRPVLLAAGVIDVGKRVKTAEGRAAEARRVPPDHDVGHVARIIRESGVLRQAPLSADRQHAAPVQDPGKAVAADAGGEWAVHRSLLQRLVVRADLNAGVPQLQRAVEIHVPERVAFAERVFADFGHGGGDLHGRKSDGVIERIVADARRTGTKDHLGDGADPVIPRGETDGRIGIGTVVVIHVPDAGDDEHSVLVHDPGEIVSAYAGGLQEMDRRGVQGVVARSGVYGLPRLLRAAVVYVGERGAVAEGIAPYVRQTVGDRHGSESGAARKGVFADVRHTGTELQREDAAAVLGPGREAVGTGGGKVGHIPRAGDRERPVFVEDPAEALSAAAAAQKEMHLRIGQAFVVRPDVDPAPGFLRAEVKHVPQAIAAAEGLAADLPHASGEREDRQAAAMAEGMAFDERQTLRDRHLRQAVEVRKGAVPDRRDAGAQLHGGDLIFVIIPGRAAVAVEIVHGPGAGDLQQAGVVVAVQDPGEIRSADARVDPEAQPRVGQPPVVRAYRNGAPLFLAEGAVHVGEGNAVEESIISDGGQGPGERHGAQIAAAGERIAADARHTRLKLHGGDKAAQIRPLGINAAGGGERGKVVVIVVHRSRAGDGEQTVLVQGPGEIFPADAGAEQIVHFRTAQRIVERINKNVTPFLCGAAEIHVRQALAVAECLVPDVYDAPRERHACQAGASLERAGADVGHARKDEHRPDLSGIAVPGNVGRHLSRAGNRQHAVAVQDPGDVPRERRAGRHFLRRLRAAGQQTQQEYQR